MFKISSYIRSLRLINVLAGLAVIIFALFVIFGGASKTYAVSDNSLSDISNHTYKQAIDYLMNKKIVQGYTDGTFKPENSINRAEFTKMVVGAEYSLAEIGNMQNCFPDVKTDWYAKYVCFAKSKGVLQGYSDGNFKPDSTINFAEASKIIVNTFNYPVNADSIWYKPYVAKLSEEKAIPISVKGFNYSINRGEMSEILWRLKEGIKNKIYLYYDTVSTQLVFRPASGGGSGSSSSSSSSTSSGGGGVVSSSTSTSGGATSSTSSGGGTSSTSSTSSSGGATSSSTSSGGATSSSTSSTSSGGGTTSSSTSSGGGSSSSSSSSGGGTATYGTTYYIRTDGGTSAQCNGKTDTAYSSSITDKACAWSHPFIALPPGGTSLIAGGDALIINNGSYKMGAGAPGATNDDKCNQAWSYECMMSVIPSGISSSQPTRILGANWNSGCTTKPELWGSGRPWAIVDMVGSDNVELQCLEITDHSECVESHSGSITCERDTAPFGDWASIGLRSSDSKNVLLKNLDIHGLAHTGIQAGRLTDWTVENTKIEGNGWVGWDGDITGNDSNSGTTTFKKVNIDWNGCGQTYPGRQPIGCWSQTAGGYGDGFGTGDTGGDWIFEDSTFLHNTSDGLDMLYHRSGGSVTIRRVHAEGNAGNQLKTSGNAEVTDSVIVGNCAYFQGKSFTHNVDNCRALGNAVSISMTGATSPVNFYNNSVYSEGDGLLFAEGSGSVKVRNSIFYAGIDYHQPSEKSFYLYSEGGTTFDNDYNLVYLAKDNGNYCSAGSNNICSTDPKFTSIGSTFNLKLQSTSPAIDKGTTSLTTIDFTGITRPKGAGVDIGAYEIK